MSATRAALAATAAGLRSESRRTAAPSSVSPTSAAIRRLSARMLAGGACLPQSGASSRSTDGTVLDWRQKLSRRRAGIRGWAHGDFPEARLTLLHLFKAANGTSLPTDKARNVCSWRKRTSERRRGTAEFAACVIWARLPHWKS